MKVSKINANAPGVVRRSQSNVAFGSKATAANDVAEKVVTRVQQLKIDKDTLSDLGKFNKLILKFGIDNDEILNAMITAFGTAIVAPIFIAFNPFAKNESKETKVYSAMRQPISAVIALGFQFSVVKFANNMLDKAASKGVFKNIGVDFDAEPRTSFVKKLIKQDGKKLKKDDLLEEVARRKDLAEEKFVQKLLANNVIPTDDDLVSGKAVNKLVKEAKKSIEFENFKNAGEHSKKELTKKAKEIAKNSALENVKAKFKGLSDSALREAKIRQSVKALIENSDSSYKIFRNVSTAVISIATLPLSCGLLNWAYPRIMEKIMPDVAAAKKASKAPKTPEAQAAKEVK